MKMHKEKLKKTNIKHKQAMEDESLKNKEFRNRMKFLSQSQNQMDKLLFPKSKSVDKKKTKSKKKSQLCGSPQSFSKIVNDIDLSQKKSTNPRRQIP